MKTFIPFLFLILTSHALAGAFDQFLTGLKKDYFFTNMDRGIELDRHIRVAKFGRLGQIMSPDAIATYNGNTNVIHLNEELLEKSGGKTRIKDAQMIRGTDFRKTYHLSTIFHEMGHAEIDVFIERGVDPEDQMVYAHYKNVLKNFYKSNFPKFNPHTVFHEHFGYYRSDLIDFLTQELDSILISNGFNKYTKTCFLNPMLKQKLKEGVSFEEFLNFFVTGDTTPYRLKISPDYVFVKGKDIYLKGARNAEGILSQTHTLFWSYHQKMYNFPMNQKDFVNRINNHSEYKSALASCRTRLWEEATR